MDNIKNNRYYLPPDFHLLDRTMQVYDDKILISKREDFSYDHVWKPLVFTAFYILSLFFNRLQEYIGVALFFYAVFNSLHETNNRVTKIEQIVLFLIRISSGFVLYQYGISYFFKYVLITEILFHLRLYFLKRKESTEYVRENLISIEFKDAKSFVHPKIYIKFLNEKNEPKLDVYSFKNDEEFKEGKKILMETGVIIEPISIT